MRIGVYVIVFVLLCGCATTQAVRIDQGCVPEYLQQEERDILEKSDKFVELLDTKGAIYDERYVEDYVNAIGRKMVPARIYAQGIDFQFKVIRDPTVNAFALANGNIYVHTGLLSRLQTEAQLAFVLGHEISHVTNRDMVYFTRSYKKKTVAAKIFDLVVTAPAAYFGVQDLMSLGLRVMYVASVTGYGREMEARSDIDAIESMYQEHYSLHEALEVFEIFLAEKEKYKKGMEIYFLSSHPSNVIRKRDITAFIEEKYTGQRGGFDSRHDYSRMMGEVKLYNAASNIKSDRPFHALDDLQDQTLRDHYPAEVYFYTGEVYRLLAENPSILEDELSSRRWKEIKAAGISQKKEEWREQAIRAYHDALVYNSGYAAPYRGLGLLYLADEQWEEANKAFVSYLECASDAYDRRFVESCLRKISDSQRSEENL